MKSTSLKQKLSTRFATFEPDPPRNFKTFRIFQIPSNRPGSQLVGLARSTEPQRTADWQLDLDRDALGLSKSQTPNSLRIWSKKANVIPPRARKRAEHVNSALRTHIDKLKAFGFREEKLLPKKLSKVLEKYSHEKLRLNLKGRQRTGLRGSFRTGRKPPQKRRNLKNLFSNAKWQKRRLESGRKTLKKKGSSKPTGRGLRGLPEQDSRTTQKKGVSLKRSKKLTDLKIDRELITSRGSTRRTRLRAFRYQNAVLVRDTRAQMGVIVFASGECFFGELDKSNNANGAGIFFFPFCGFVSGRFKNNRVNGGALLKEPNGSVVIARFERGIIQDTSVNFQPRAPGRVQTDNLPVEFVVKGGSRALERITRR